MSKLEGVFFGSYSLANTSNLPLMSLNDTVDRAGQKVPTRAWRENWRFELSPQRKGSVEVGDRLTRLRILVGLYLSLGAVFLGGIVAV